MADTVITNTPGTRDDGTGALAWVVALIVIVAVIVAGYVWVRRGAAAPAPSSAGASINVQLPSSGGTGGTGGATQ